MIISEGIMVLAYVPFPPTDDGKRIRELEYQLKNKTIENECLEKSLHALTEKIDAVSKLVCVGYASEDNCLMREDTHRIEQAQKDKQ